VTGLAERRAPCDHLLAKYVHAVDTVAQPGIQPPSRRPLSDLDGSGSGGERLGVVVPSYVPLALSLSGRCPC
jgi:hypothetical protein